MKKPFSFAHLIPGRRSASSPRTEEDNEEKKDDPPPEEVEEEQEKEDKAEEEEEEEQKEAAAEARGRQAERTRCAAIFQAASADQVALAAELAFNTDMDAKTAGSVLKAAGPGGRRGLAAAMASHQAPAIGPGAAERKGATARLATAMDAEINRLTGGKP